MAVRHSIDKTSIQTVDNGDVTAFCFACNKRRKIFTFNVFDSKLGVPGTTYRCAEVVNKRYVKKSVAKSSTQQPETAWAAPSLGDDVASWDQKQGGDCALCGVHARWNSKTESRKLYVVPCGRDEILRGLYCWDCRAVLQSWINDDMSMRVKQILSAERIRFLPPNK
jgi:hypothetical protein